MNDGVYLIALALVSLALPVVWAWWEHSSSKINIKKEQWLTATARFFYFIGLPYLGLISGVLSPRFLGLKSLEALIALNSDETFLVGWQKAVTLILLECLGDSGLVISLGIMALLLLAGLRLALARWGLESLGSPFTPAEIIYDSLHWAFYRAIFWLLTGDLYLGVVLGTAWMLLEWALIAWAGKTHSWSKPALLNRVILLILTATIFWYAPNLWLLWPLHWAMAVVLTLRLQPPLANNIAS